MALDNIIKSSLSLYLFDKKALRSLETEPAEGIFNSFLFTLFSFIVIIVGVETLLPLPYFTSLSLLFQLSSIPTFFIIFCMLFFGWNAVHWLVFRYFGGKADLEEHLRFGIAINFMNFPLGLVHLIILLTAFTLPDPYSTYLGLIFFPSLSLLLLLWRLCVNIFIFSSIHSLNRKRSLLASLLPSFLLFSTYFIMVLIFFLHYKDYLNL
ncbi:hypothetical protein H6501_01545 [Candidatus Woesearchaeota archaeon]|nr:hypothetical protein [Nanoarchaeota archaeon]MCB9370259.1 hypothetical protein [Candidatus Woesearchaeota archaeon]USN44783.1 MAG: hypothetical protein H6500_02990 [Candidatus Woesearchaeota archaeon]